MWLNKLAYESKLLGKSVALKTLFCIGTLILCITFQKNSFSAFVLFLMGVLSVNVSGVPFIKYIRLCALPTVFIVMMVFAIVVSYSKNGGGLLSIPFFYGYVIITKTSLMEGLTVFLNCMAGIGCMYFLCVTTPMEHILGLLEKIKTPKIVVELMLMIYRFIFVLLDMARSISISQKSRFGNISYGSSLGSVGILASSIFVRALKKSMDVLSAMEARGYDGTMDYTQTLTVATTKEKLMLGGYFICLFLAGGML